MTPWPMSGRTCGRVSALAKAAAGRLVSGDDDLWGLPGGRPEPGRGLGGHLAAGGGEEACATVTGCRLLGFGRGVCVRGREAGLVLVRALWRAEVRLDPWVPRFEMRRRHLVPAAEAFDSMWIPDGHGPMYRRIFAEAALAAGAVGP